MEPFGGLTIIQALLFFASSIVDVKPSFEANSHSPGILIWRVRIASRGDRLAMLNDCSSRDGRNVCTSPNSMRGNVITPPPSYELQLNDVCRRRVAAAEALGGQRSRSARRLTTWCSSESPLPSLQQVSHFNYISMVEGCDAMPQRPHKDTHRHP